MHIHIWAPEHLLAIQLNMFVERYLSHWNSFFCYEVLKAPDRRVLVQRNSLEQVVRAQDTLIFASREEVLYE